MNTLRADGAEPATALLMDGAGYHIEADLRWLDDCEARLADLKGTGR
jgi:hypothetical protein